MKNFNFIKATNNDIDQIMIIIEDARIRMKKDGLIQWQDGYPNKDTILDDIKIGQLYKYEFNNTVAGICVINSDFYEPYPPHASKEQSQTIHRFAINTNFLGQGIGQKLFEAAEREILNNGFTYAIVDTYTQNKKMVNLIEKREFKNLGEFPLMKEFPNWVLYQKNLSSL